MLPSEEKQAALDRHRAIILATFDYHLAQHAGALVVDGTDFVADHYIQQKLQTEKYYEQQQLDTLEQNLASISENMISEALAFMLHLKETTGYEIDLTINLRERVEVIIQQNEIRSPEDYQDVCKMLSFYHQTEADSKKIFVLEKILELPNAVVTVRSSGEDPFIENLYLEAVSSDGMKKLRIEKSGKEERASTYIVIFLKNGSSSVFYDIRGHHPDLKAYWKDDYNIIVETKMEYKGFKKIRKIESDGEIIDIEYIEH